MHLPMKMAARNAIIVDTQSVNVCIGNHGGNPWLCRNCYSQKTIQIFRWLADPEQEFINIVV